MTTVIFSNGKKYTFFPDSVTNPELFTIDSESTVINDVYETSSAKVTVTGKLIVCNDITKLRVSNNSIRKETYQQYIADMDKNGDRYMTRDSWIYNILDGVSEQDSIIARTDRCIVLPNYTWKGVDVSKLQILTIPVQRDLRTLRDLTGEHVELLKHMKETTLSAIMEKYGLGSEKLKLFFHYAPSTYHLHIHFVNIENVDAFSSVEYCHDLDSVIFNLEIKSDYYKEINLNRRG